VYSGYIFPAQHPIDLIGNQYIEEIKQNYADFQIMIQVVCTVRMKYYYKRNMMGVKIVNRLYEANMTDRATEIYNAMRDHLNEYFGNSI
jgi:hypothetical protein